jgi:ribosomal protein L20A (L18A)
MKFTVSGSIKLKKGPRSFSKDIEAKSKNDATQKVYALFGSSNRLKRNAVEIKEISEAK